MNAPNRFMKPVVQQAPTPSPLQQFSATQFAGLEPILGDLVTPVAAPNRFQQAKIQADPTKVAERLKGYNVYDTTLLGGLTDYFKPHAAATQNNLMYFKPEQFDMLQSQLSGLSGSELNALRPLLGDTPMIGGLGETSFFKKDELEKALTPYASYNAEQIAKMSALPEFSKLKPLANVGGNAFYNKAQLESAINAYMNVDPTKLGEDWLSNQLRGKLIDVDGNKFLAKSDYEWAQNPFGDKTFIDPNDPTTYESLGFKLDPNYDFWARKKLIDEQGNSIQPFSWSARDAKEYYHQRAPWDSSATVPLWAYLDMGYTKDPTTGAYKESSYFLPISTFTPQQLVDGRYSEQHWLDLPEKLAPSLAKHGAFTKVNNQDGFAFPSWQAYLDAVKEAGMDPYASIKANMQWYKEPKKKGGFLGSLAKIMNVVAPILAFTPLAPIAAGYALGSGVANGNPLQIAGGLLGMPGPGGATLGSSLSNSLGSSLQSGLGLSADTMKLLGGASGLGNIAIQGGLGGINAVMQDKNPLLGMATGALGSFAGQQAGQFFGGLGGVQPKGSFGSDLQGLLGKVGSGAVRNYIQSGFKPIGALGGAIGGAASGLGGMAASQLGLSDKWGGNAGQAFGALSNPLIRQMLAKKLAR